MPKLMQGFTITSTDPIDKRLTLTKAQMLSTNDNLMPDKYFCICLDDGHMYLYDKSATANAVTGKFTELDLDDDSVVHGYYLNNKFYTDSTYTVELEKNLETLYIDDNNSGDLYTWDGTNFNRSVDDATISESGIVKLYHGVGENEDGAMTQKAIKEALNNIKFDVDDSDSECLILELPTI